MNNIGTFMCMCAEGFDQTDDNECLDINECVSIECPKNQGKI